MRSLPVQGKRVAVVLSGGNIDVNLVSRIIERGLVKTGRMVRLFLTVPDIAGSLAQIAHFVANRRANILEINHDRAFSGAELGETSIELVLETQGFAHIEDIRKIAHRAQDGPVAMLVDETLAALRKLQAALEDYRMFAACE